MVVFAKLRIAFGSSLFIILLVTLLHYIAILRDSNDQEVAGHFLSKVHVLVKVHLYEACEVYTKDGNTLQ